MIALKLHREVSKVCPIYGVSIGDENDKSTWKFHPMGEASQPQLDAAAIVIQSFIYSEVLTDQEKTDKAIEALDVTPREKVLLKQIFQLRKLHDPSLTLAQFRQEVINDYKAFI